MVFGMTYYQICWYFLIYSFLGWCVEVVYHAVTIGKIINRGFLNGPVCPVYGFGMLAVCAMVNTISSGAETSAAAAQNVNVVAVFFGGMILATLVELIAGFLLYRCFHARWWDYSDKPFNIGGYICPEYSIFWGLGTVLVVKFVHPVIADAASESRISPGYGWWILLVLYALYLADLLVTIATVSGLNRKLKELDKVNSSMRIVSDAMSKALGESSLEASQKLEEGKVQAVLAKAELRYNAAQAYENAQIQAARSKAAAAKKRDERIRSREAAKDEFEQKRAALMQRAAQLSADITGHRHFGSGRLLKAFPNIQHRDFKELVHNLQSIEGMSYEEIMEQIRKKTGSDTGK